jgi:hypothetical protein
MQRYLTWIVFIVLVGATVVLAAKSIGTDLRGSRAFERAELETWLASPTPDTSPIVRRRAARQLDRDLYAGFDWQSVVDELPPERRATFVANFQSLLVLLLEQRADTLRAQPPYRRDAYLDAQLQEMATWYVVGVKGKLEGPSMVRQGLIGLSGGAVQTGASPKVREFVSALQSHLLKRSFERVLPGERNPPR